MTSAKKALLLIGSAKPEGQSTSEALGAYLLEQLVQHGWTGERQYIHRAMRTQQRAQELLPAVDHSDLLILAFPLYIDSLPYLVIQALELIAAHRQAHAPASQPRFVALVNCGFPEAQHNETALAICGEFARQAQLTWAGGLALGQGGAIAGRPLAEVGGRAHHVCRALDLAAAALAQGQPVPAEASALMAKPIMPAFFYMLMGNVGWYVQAHEQGGFGHLRDQPFSETPDQTAPL